MGRILSPSGMALSTCLNHAIRNRHIWPAFQPIIDLHSGAIAGYEILARWSDPNEGDISPQDFIPQLEKCRIIDTLFDNLVSQSCLEAAQWEGAFTLAFNVSPVQLTDKTFPQRVVNIVSPTGFPLDRFQIEITEGSLIADEITAYSILRDLDALGIRIAIDDFGTGYSSLARLEEFPFHKLKIDARFVHSLDSTPSKRRIAAAIIGLGQSLGIDVVAEGVETPAEEAVLRELGCDLGQGWLYGKGVRAQETLRLQEQRGSIHAPRQSLSVSPFQQHYQLAILYEQAPVALAFVSPDFRHVRANNLFADMHGMTGAALAGKSIYDVMQGTNLYKAEATLRKAARSSAPVCEYYAMGDKYVLVFVSRIMDAGNELIGFSVMAVDVTKHPPTIQLLMEGEEHCRRAFEIHLHIVWVTAPDGTLIYISPTNEDLPGDTMRNRLDRWLGKIHPDDRGPTEAAWRQTISSHRDHECEFRISHTDGAYRRVRSRMCPHQAEDGSVVRWYGAFWDIDDTETVAE